MTELARRALCRCGHDRDAHAHYRGGTECVLCPPGECPRFRSGLLPRLRRWWRARD
jgi:hypothetical protein